MRRGSWAGIAIKAAVALVLAILALPRLSIRAQLEPEEEPEEGDEKARIENYLYCVGKARK